MRWKLNLACGWVLARFSEYTTSTSCLELLAMDECWLPTPRLCNRLIAPTAPSCKLQAGVVDGEASAHLQVGGGAEFSLNTGTAPLSARLRHKKIDSTIYVQQFKEKKEMSFAGFRSLLRIVARVLSGERRYICTSWTSTRARST